MIKKVDVSDVEFGKEEEKFVVEEKEDKKVFMLVLVLKLSFVLFIVSGVKIDVLLRVE